MVVPDRIGSLSDKGKHIMKTTLGLFICVVLIPALTACDSSTNSASSIGQGGGVHFVADEFAMVIPQGWRRMGALETGGRRLYLSGAGIAAAEKDETGTALHILVTIERAPQTTVPLAAQARELVKEIRSNSRLQLVGEAQFDTVSLSDGTAALLVTMEVIRMGCRRSLEMKLLTQDSSSSTWVATGIVNGSIDSIKPAPGGMLGEMVRGHLTTLCFDAATLGKKSVSN
jgi:hypothetical protein